MSASGLAKCAGRRERFAPRLRCALTLLVVLAAPRVAGALELREDFEGWTWDPGCHEARSACFAVAGCVNGRALFIRRVNGRRPINQCDYGREVRQWTGERLPPSGEARGPEGGDWAAAHVASPESGDSLELLSSRSRQSNARFGEMQADFFVRSRGDLPRGSDEHYLVFHNLALEEIAGCSADCPGAASDSSTSYATDEKRRWRWYGVIAGGFGERGGIGYGRLGFVVEVPNDDPARPVDLIDESFLPFGEDTGRFPANRWYRVKIRRALDGGADRYSYSVALWEPTRSQWTTIGSRSFPSDLLRAHSGDFLPAGYVGVSDAFFDPARAREGVRVDWDNLRADW